jgi:hypothetical protein
LLLELNFFVLFTGRARLYKRLERQPGQNQGYIDFLTVFRQNFPKNWNASPVYSPTSSGSNSIIILTVNFIYKPKINKASPTFINTITLTKPYRAKILRFENSIFLYSFGK